MFHNAQVAHEAYLALPPLQRSDIRPTSEHFTTVTHSVERYMRRHILRTMPKHVQQALLHMEGVTCSDVLFQALVDAGPGTEGGRAFTLASVASNGPTVPVHGVYEALHK